MRDAIGGTVTLFIISVFIVLALGYLAFNVNYTKAFRMKDKIITIYENNEGCVEKTSKCYEEINKYATKIGYKPDNINCPDNSYSGRPDNSAKLYCVKGVNTIPQNTNVSDRKPKCYYRIVTKITISIPIIENLLDIDVFKVKGDTKAIELQHSSSSENPCG